ncbi:MAG: hypothetical protein Kow00121_10220 [Elainellaceae cyanobacterium]
MLTRRTVLIVNSSDDGNIEYEHQLQQDRGFAYNVLREWCGTRSPIFAQTHRLDGILLVLGAGRFDLLEQLQEQMSEYCPPIVVIGGSDAEMAVRAIKSGAADYLIRDRMTADSLRLAMRNAIENAELRQELQRSQQQFQTSVENMLDCFGIFSALRDESGQIVDFRIDYLNGAACENNQMPKKVQIGRGLCEILPAHRESSLFDEYCQVVETGEPLIKDSLIYDDTFGERRLSRVFDIRATKLNDGFVASWRDITDRKHLELELSQTVVDLQQQQQQLQQLIDTAPIGIAIRSASGKVKVINDAMLHLHGLTRQEFEQQGMNWRDFTPPELSAQTEQAIAQLQQQGFLPSEEKELLRRDGTRLPVWISAVQCMNATDEHVAFAVDLSQQKQAEAAIQQLNQELTDRVSELQTLLDILPVGVAIATDPTCTQMQSNAYIRQMLGVHLGDNISKSAPATRQPPYRTFQNGQEIPAENLPMQMAARLGIEVRDVEFDILLPDGSMRQLLCYATPLQDNQAQIRGVVGAFLDITERNRDAAALRASQQRYQELAEAMPQMVWTADATGAVDYWNQRWYEYTGLSKAESMGLVGIRTVHPNERDRTLAQWSQAIANGEPFEIEFRIRRWDGEYHWFISRAIQTRDSQGQITGWIGTITDIDNQKQLEAKLLHEIANHQHTEQELRRGEERLDLAMNAAKMGSWDWDIQTGKVNWSTNLEHLFGMAPGSFDNRYETVRAMIHPDDLNWVEQAIHRAIYERADYNIEFRFIKPDGTARWALGLGRVFYDASGNPVTMTGVDMDISERKQVEEDLRASEERFRQMADNAPMMIWVTDATGYCTYLSKRWYEFTNQTEATGLGFGWLEAVHPDDREFSKAIFLNAIKHQADFRLEYRLRRHDGQYRWAIDAASPWLGENGEFKGYIGSVIDISDRKQIEQELQESEARFRTLADNISQFAWMADETGWIFWYNQRWFDYTGTTLEEMQGWGWQQVHHPDYVEQVSNKFRNHIEMGQSWEDTFPLRGKDGQYRWFLSRAIPVRDEQDRVLRWFGTNTDVTDLQQTELALRQATERLNLALKSAPITLFNQGLDLRYTWIHNPTHNYLVEQVIGLRDEDLASPDTAARLTQLKQQVLDTGIGLREEVKVSRDEQTSYYDLTIDPIWDSQNAIVGITCAAVDISERVQLEAEREKLLQQERAAREAAERANRIKDEFLAILSHELRSPLNPILGWTKLLQTRKFDGARVTEALAVIERNAKLQTQLIDDLLDVAKILRGKLSLSITSVNLCLIMEAAIDTVQTAAAAKSISLYPVLPDIGQVSGDAARLQQVVWNLLSNAIKFTPDGGRVDIWLEQVGHQAQITVSDTGKGISPDFLPHLFESFRQEDASTTRKYGGLGLGLAIVRQLVEAHGGTIWADSAGEGLGATFTVQLPLLKNGSGQVWESQTAHSPMAPLPPQPLSSIRILAVDDDADARELLTVLLTQYGAEVLTVASATEVLTMLESFQPDVLVSDIGMPEVDGYSLIQQIRALAADKGGQVPAIALTAYARETDYQQAITSGYQRHITKPLEPEQLVQAIVDTVNADSVHAKFKTQTRD